MNIFEVIFSSHKTMGIWRRRHYCLLPNMRTKLKNLLILVLKILLDKNYSFNAKMSDWSCSVILDRINNYDKWSPKYKKQYKRVKKIIFDNFNFYKILDKQTQSPKNYIAIICNKKVDNNLLRKTRYLEFKKYYKPLSKSLKNCNAKKILKIFYVFLVIII